MQAPFAQGTAGIGKCIRGGVGRRANFFKKTLLRNGLDERSLPRAPIAFFSLLIYVDPLSGEHILVEKRKTGRGAHLFKLRTGVFE